MVTNRIWPREAPDTSRGAESQQGMGWSSAAAAPAAATVAVAFAPAKPSPAPWPPPAAATSVHGPGTPEQAGPEPAEPTRPQGGALTGPAPSGVAPLRPAVTIIGAHGGSATTTVAGFVAGFPSWLNGGVDVYDDGDRLPTDLNAGVVVITARGTGAGLAAAHRQVGAVEQQLPGVPLVLVVTADGPWPLPAVARDRIRAVSGRVQMVVRLPYVTRWRFADQPEAPPARYLSGVRRLCEAIETSAMAAR